ncbi:MAG TPA: hypothetical protein O0X64_00625 [Methanocorpusculum sp.]|nr:hypothetical protein [Methanocorpusculum sp.]
MLESLGLIGQMLLLQQHVINALDLVICWIAKRYNVQTLGAIINQKKNIRDYAKM